MADYSKDDILQLIKKFGAFLTLKMSNLFYGLDSQSVGAIAGLAVAIVFTWRLLRSPSEPQRRQPKRRMTANSTSGIVLSNPTQISSGISAEDSSAQNVIDDFFQPVKPTLGQIVRQRLSEGRKVTCRLLGVILVESTPEELQKQATVRSSVLEVLLEITKFCDLYLMERVLDDESEKKVLTTLEDAGIFTSGGLIKDKVLFCSTETGRTSFVRQLEPDWHIDTNPEIIHQLSVPTMGEMIDQWKKKNNVFGIFYRWFFAKVASKLEVFPDCEFRVAYEEAMKYGGKVILGDRPVKITLERMWGKMPLWHKFKILYSLVSEAILFPSPEHATKKLKKIDDVDMTLVFQKVSKEFPTVMETIVHERDKYMSSRLLQVASEHSSVVAVVGKGHLQGIKKHWKQPVELNDLLAMPTRKGAISAVKILQTIGVTVAGVAIISGLYLSSKK